MKDYAFMMRNTERFMSLWRSYRPVMCKVHGFAVAGGSDIALCSDMIVMAEDARIGYPPVRVWGCPTTARTKGSKHRKYFSFRSFTRRLFAHRYLFDDATRHPS